MPQLPSTLGPLNIPQSRSRVVQPDFTTAGQINERANQQLISQVGGALEQVQQTKDTADLSAAQSQFLQTKVAQDNAYQDDKDWQTMPDRYQANMMKARDDAANLISSPALRNKFISGANLDVARGSMAIRNLAKSKQSDQGRADLVVGLNNNLQSASMTSDSNTRAGLLKAMNGQIDAAAGQGWLDQEGAARLKVEYGNKYIAQRQNQLNTELSGKLDTIVANADANPDMNASVQAIDQAAAQYQGSLPADQLIELTQKAKNQAFVTALKSDNLTSSKAFEVVHGRQPLNAVPPQAAPTPELMQAITQRGEFGKTGDRNPASGALGKFQMLPSTAREVAAQVGVPFDQMRLQYDDAYGQQLATAYMGNMLTKYSGNVTLATAAYNAGPGRVDDWLRQYGDPRAGQTTDAEWAASIPFDETRAYVGRVVGGMAVPDKSTPQAQQDITQLGADPAAMPQYNAIIDAKRARENAQNEAQWTAQRRDLAGRWDDHIASLQATGKGTLTLTDYQQSMSPTDYASLERQQNAAITFNGVVQPIVTGTPQEAAQALDKLRPMPGDPDYASKEKAYDVASSLRDKRVEGLQKDPAGYVLQNDAAASDAGAELDTLDVNDPEQQAQAKVDLDVIRSSQRRMGVPDDQIRPLSDAKAAAVGQELMTAEPAKVTGLLDQYSSIYGPDGAKQILAAKGVSPGMRYIAMMGDPSDAVLRQRAVMAAQTPHDDLVNGIKSKQITEDQVRTAVDAVIPPALAARPGWASYETGMTNTAMWLIGQGMSQAQAIDAVYAPWKRKYKTTDTLSIPIKNPSDPSVVGYDADKVITGLDGAVQNIGKFDIDPKGGGPLGVSANWTLEQTQQSLKMAHKWVTLPDDSGAVLTYDQGDGLPGAPVMLKNGQRLTVKFQDAQAGVFGFFKRGGPKAIGPAGILPPSAPTAPQTTPRPPVAPVAPKPPKAPVAPQAPAAPRLPGTPGITEIPTPGAPTAPTAPLSPVLPGGN